VSAQVEFLDIPADPRQGVRSVARGFYIVFEERADDGRRVDRLAGGPFLYEWQAENALRALPPRAP
jgi:hypothetical protein